MHPRAKILSVAASAIAVAIFTTTLLAQHAFTPEEIADGGRLFQANCTGCHGSAGDQVQGVSLMSGRFRRATTDDEVAAIIRKGVPGTAMQSFAFSEQQTGMIVAYLKSFAGGAAIAAADMPALGDAGRGKQVFESKGNCLSCHRVGNTGSRVGPDLSSIGLPRPPIFRFVGVGAPPPAPSPAAVVQQLQRDLLDPDAEISPANRMFRAVQKDGSIVTGRLLNLDQFTVQLLDSKERLVSLQRSELREFGPMKSAMPSYRDKLTPQEISDLLAYLFALKGQVQ
jgi:mono/diheme cytochrome c family protein